MADAPLVVATDTARLEAVNPALPAFDGHESTGPRLGTLAVGDGLDLAMSCSWRCCASPR